MPAPALLAALLGLAPAAVAAAQRFGPLAQRAAPAAQAAYTRSPLLSPAVQRLMARGQEYVRSPLLAPEAQAVMARGQEYTRSPLLTPEIQAMMARGQEYTRSPLLSPELQNIMSRPAGQTSAAMAHVPRAAGLTAAGVGLGGLGAAVDDWTTDSGDQFSQGSFRQSEGAFPMDDQPVAGMSGQTMDDIPPELLPIVQMLLNDYLDASAAPADVPALGAMEEGVGEEMMPPAPSQGPTASLTEALLGEQPTAKPKRTGMMTPGGFVPGYMGIRPYETKITEGRAPAPPARGRQRPV